MATLDVSDPRHPLHLQPSDNPGNVIISIQLKGSENYSVWSRAMKIALRAKRKMGFIDGTCTKDLYKDDLEEEWERVNATILTWIMNTVSKELVNGIVYADDAHAVWVDLQERFNKVNGSRIYNLHREIATISQGTCDISSYHSRLRLLWDEYQSLIPALCGCVISRDFVVHLEQKKLFQFMMGLNESYNAIRSQILLMTPSPSVSQAHAILVHEESQRKICETSSQGGIVSDLHENTVLMSLHNNQHRQKGFNSYNNTGYSSYNSNSFCDLCKKKGHTQNICYRLIGYPPGYKGKKKPMFNQGNNNIGDNAWDRQTNMVMQDTVNDKGDAGHRGNSAGNIENGQRQYNQRINMVHASGGGDITQRSQPQDFHKPNPNICNKSGSRGPNYFTDQQYSQIMSMLDKGKGVEQAGTMAGPLYWESEGDW